MLTSGRKKRAVSVEQHSGSAIQKSVDQPGIESGIGNCVKLESYQSSSPKAEHDRLSARKDTAILKAGPSQPTTIRAKIPKKSRDERVSNSAAAEATVLTVMTPSNSKSELKLTIKRNLSHTTTDSGSSRSSRNEEEQDDANNKYNESDSDEVSSEDDSDKDRIDEDSEDDSSKAEESDSDDDKPIKKHVVSNRKGQIRDRRRRQKDSDTDSDQEEESPTRHLNVKVRKRKTSRKSSSNHAKKRLKRESSTSSQEVGCK